MAKIKYHTIRVTVDSVVGKCPLGNKKGKEFIIRGTTPAGMCMGAFGSIYSAVQVLKYGGTFPWENDPDVAYINCPDHINRVVYKLERLKEEDNDECS